MYVIKSNLNFFEDNMLISQTIQPHRVLLMLAFGVMLSACGKPSNEQNAAGGAPAMPVTVQAVTAETVPIQTEVVAQTEGAKQIEVAWPRDDWWKRACR